MAAPEVLREPNNDYRLDRSHTNLNLTQLSLNADNMSDIIAGVAHALKYYDVESYSSICPFPRVECWC